MCRSYNDLSSAAIASGLRLHTASTNALLSSRILMILGSHRVSNRVYIILVLIRNLNNSLLVEYRVHAIVEAAGDELTNIFFNIIMKHYFEDFVSESNTRKSCNRLQSQISYFFLGIVKKL